MAGRDRVRESFLVENATTGGVDEADPGLRLCEQLLADKPDRLGRLRQRYGHEVSNREPLLETHELGANRPPAFWGHIRVIGNKAHPERGGALGDECAY